MTSGELAEYRREVRAALVHAGKQVGQDVIHRRAVAPRKPSSCTVHSISGLGSGL